MRRRFELCFAFALAVGCAIGAVSKTAVADAAMHGDRQAVRELVRQKADVNAPQVDGTTALHWAVQADDLEMADLLIRAGAKVSGRECDGRDAAATGRGQRQLHDDRTLIAAGADPSAPLTKSGDTALMMASRTGKVDAVRSVTGPRREDKRAGNLGWHHGLDVGGFRTASRGSQDADRPRGGRECAVLLRSICFGTRLRRDHAGAARSRRGI